MLWSTTPSVMGLMLSYGLTQKGVEEVDSPAVFPSARRRELSYLDLWLSWSASPLPPFLYFVVLSSCVPGIKDNLEIKDLPSPNSSRTLKRYFHSTWSNAFSALRHILVSIELSNDQVVRQWVKQEWMKTFINIINMHVNVMIQCWKVKGNQLANENCEQKQ